MTRCSISGGEKGHTRFCDVVVVVAIAATAADTAVVAKNNNPDSGHLLLF